MFIEVIYEYWMFVEKKIIFLFAMCFIFQEGRCCGGRGQDGGCCMTNGNGNEEHPGDKIDVNIQFSKVFSNLLYVSDHHFCVFMQEATSLFSTADFAPFDPTQEIIFPPELMVNNKHNETFRLYQVPKLQFFN